MLTDSVRWVKRPQKRALNATLAFLSKACPKTSATCGVEGQLLPCSSCLALKQLTGLTLLTRRSLNFLLLRLSNLTLMTESQSSAWCKNSTKHTRKICHSKCIPFVRPMACTFRRDHTIQTG